MKLIGYADYPDPPETPTHGPCDGCGEIFDNGDLWRVRYRGEERWLCPDCLEKFTEGGDE